MKIATWNVNGIRARKDDVAAFVEQEQPDVLCLQELKATPDQIPAALTWPDYWGYWHGGKGYSGVSLHVRKTVAVDSPRFWHPEFDHENRIVVAKIGSVSVASIYVPNGGRDFAAKMGFLRALEAYAIAAHGMGSPLLLCGDLNVARSERDVHPKQRDPRAIGQRPEERAWFERSLEAAGLHDVSREREPENDALFTWWAPWRNLRARNIGWRLDYVLATVGLAQRATASSVFRESGTSDHGAVVVEFDCEF